MTIIKVSYGKTYNLGNYCSHRIDLEASIDEEEDVQYVLSSLKQQCDLFHTTNVPTSEIPYQELPDQQHYSVMMETLSKEPTQPLTQEQRFLNLISLATSLNELSIYQKTANNPKYPNLKEAYDNKLNELTK